MRKATLSILTATVLAATFTSVQISAEQRHNRFKHSGHMDVEEATSRRAADDVSAMEAPSRAADDSSITEAVTGFDNQSNGYLDQGPAFDTLTDETVVALRSFNDNRFIFEEVETIADGLGPVYNAQSCRECHQNVVTGGASQITVQRTGRLDKNQFFESLGGTIIHSRAIGPEIVERVAAEDNVRTFRISTNTLGAGYVEAISNETLLGIRAKQPRFMRGVALMTPVLEADNAARIGRFGWKSQHASLESFAADAYLNEMGITSPLFPDENTSSGVDVSSTTEVDSVPDPEDDGIDLIAFAEFMRSTKAPSRGKITAEAQAGERVFNRVGCNSCHVESLVTAPPGTVINGGTFTIPEALGNKRIHPYSDFLLHNIGTGDGIPVQSTNEYAHTANLIRTAPLWGLRTRSRLMHDGLSFTKEHAIRRHKGQARAVTRKYHSLPNEERELLNAFLDSL